MNEPPVPVGDEASWPRDPTGLAQAVIRAQYAYLITVALNGVAWAWRAIAVATADPALGERMWDSLAPANISVFVSAVLSQLAWLVSGFLVLKWIYRTNRNAHTLASGMSMLPSANVGLFFLPVANFWMPFRGVRETWQVSAEPSNWRSVPVPAVFRWWWGLLLLQGAMGVVSLRLQETQQLMGDGIRASLFEAAVAGEAVLLTLALVRVVRMTTQAQTLSIARAALE